MQFAWIQNTAQMLIGHLKPLKTALRSRPMAGIASLVLVGVWSLSGCASAEKSGEAALPGEAPVWPAPPEQPRIAYLKSISRPGDAGVKVSGFSRLANWITGGDKGNERLDKPFGVAVDEDDNLCLTDTGAAAVCCFDRLRKKWRRWDSIGDLRFVSPVAIGRRKGVFFVADSGLASVVAFDDRGRLQFQITNRLVRPSGLAILGDRLLVADSQRHCVVAFNLQGSHLFEFGRRGSGPGEFNFPTHLATDAVGHIYVTDSMNGRVLIFDREGKFTGRIGSMGDTPGSFSRPKGVAVDSYGHVYVVDALFDNIQIFDREGRFLLSLGEPGAGAGQFWLANGIAITRQNEIFVADSYNHRVQTFRYVGPP